MDVDVIDNRSPTKTGELEGKHTIDRRVEASQSTNVLLPVQRRVTALESRGMPTSETMSILIV